MKTAIIFSLLLTACYDKSDAIEQVRLLARPEPIRCSQTSGGGDGSYKSFTCTDGDAWVWACDDDGCVNIDRMDRTPERP